MPLDFTLTPIYRINGQDQSSLPGLLAAVPPRKTARGRDQDRLVVYLLLTGNAVFSTGEYVQFASRAAVAFYETQGTLTSALRAAAESINKPLLERNMTTSGRGQYAVGLLALAAIRESQVTFLVSGPLHIFTLGTNGAGHIFDSASGKGLGLNATYPYHFSQAALQPNDRLLFTSKIPSTWEGPLTDTSPASLDATRRRLLAQTTDDINAVLIQATDGQGALTVLRPTGEAQVAETKVSALPSSDVNLPHTQEAETTPEPGQTNPAPQAHMLQPSAYGIPPQPKEEMVAAEASAASTNLLDALPRARQVDPPLIEEEPIETPIKPSTPCQPSARTRQTAKAVVNGMQVWRQGMERLSAGMQKFLPRLLPGSEESAPVALHPSVMILIASLVPLVVVIMATVIYFHYGQSVEYEEYLVQANNERTQAVSLAANPAAQREAWQRELFYLDKADENNGATDATRQLRQEAQGSLDKLEGMTRLQFQPVLNSGVGTQISRLAANENDLYLLDAQRGGILHIALTSGGFQQDNAFNCQPGSYASYTVGPLVDIIAMPPVNAMNASVIGVDASGNLLYCAPGQVAQAIPLPPPDTNWGRVTAFTLDSGNLYVLDARSRAVWVYQGKDGAFIDRPYFFFGGQIPALDDAIDLAVSGDDLYILHSDGHLSHCSYSRIDTVPTRCDDPAVMTNPLPAYGTVDLFKQAHFTQMMFTPAPDSALLLLDTDGQGIFRLTPRSLELQSQLRPLAGRANPLPPGPVGAMTVSPNHVLYMAVQDKVYFAVDSP